MAERPRVILEGYALTDEAAAGAMARVLDGNLSEADVRKARMFLIGASNLIDAGLALESPARAVLTRALREMVVGKLPEALHGGGQGGRPEKDAEHIALAAMVRLLEIAGYDLPSAKRALVDSGIGMGLEGLNKGIRPWKFEATDEPKAELASLVSWTKAAPRAWKNLLGQEVAERCWRRWDEEVLKARTKPTED